MGFSLNFLQVCGEEYTVCGGSMPQCSLDHTQLVDVVEQISNACKERGLRGHLSLDLLTFISPENVRNLLVARPACELCMRGVCLDGAGGVVCGCRPLLQ